MENLQIWQRDLPKILRKFYNQANQNFPPDTDQALIDLTEWLIRIPSQSPKKVHISQELNRKILTPFELQSLNQIKHTTEQGKDLKPYLGDLTRQIRNRRSQKNDFFASDWGLLHLHLGADFENKHKRVSRSKRILIARFEHKDAYFIDVVNHGRGHPEVWGDTQHLKILYRNWSHVMEPYRLRGILPPSTQPTSNEYINLRNNRANTQLYIGDQVFLPMGMGITGDGSQMQAVRKSLTYMRELNANERHFLTMIQNNKVFLSIKSDDGSIGYLLPENNTFHSTLAPRTHSQTAYFFKHLLSELPIKDSLPYKGFITPKRLRR